MKKLAEATTTLGDAYIRWKSSEKEKNEAKDAFFALATEEASKQVPAQIYEEIHAANEDQAKKKAQKKFPRFVVLDVLPLEDGNFRVALEENPKYQNFSYTNPENGMVYQRQVVEGSVFLDETNLRHENGELWHEISELKRVLRPLESLTPDQLAAIQPYVFKGKPVIKLVPPKPEKTEEE